ncbi:hypothetical protein [Burkholderia gladioli]|uniref:hypothetical protein n=1 Tax=Burkholderia gladioli TaxID=28095 RepID=UPI001C5CEFEB|nr:hypothetical protein [Burkholderia gladioli]MBW5284190.1 hypothetical protein [Burkholderia gladioli]
MALDPAAHASFRDDLARLRDLVRDSDDAGGRQLARAERDLPPADERPAQVRRRPGDHLSQW